MLRKARFDERYILEIFIHLTETEVGVPVRRTCVCKQVIQKTQSFWSVVRAHSFCGKNQNGGRCVFS